MGNVSIFELLLVMLLVGSIVLVVTLLRKVSRFEAWLLRRLEARFVPSAELPAGAAREDPKPWWFPLPLSFAAGR